jgi:hypothetical protein
MVTLVFICPTIDYLVGGNKVGQKSIKLEKEFKTINI